jgi:hypothetical protein
MNTDERQIDGEKAQTPIDYKERYESAVDQSIGTDFTKHCAGLVMARMMSIKPNSKSTQLTKEIEVFAKNGDVEKILELSVELRKLKDIESERLEHLASMRSEYSFEELLSAFPEELQALAFEMAYNLLTSKGAGASVQTARTRSRTVREGKKYVVSKGDQSMVVQANTSRSKAFGADREFFSLVGFTVSEDGKALEPAAFISHDGVEVDMKKISKRVILEDMTTGNDYWRDQGLSIKDFTEVSADDSASQASVPAAGTQEGAEFKPVDELAGAA